jgi:hypothetical protein
MRVGVVLGSRASRRWHPHCSNTALRAATYILVGPNSKIKKGHALGMNEVCSLLILASLGSRIEDVNSSDGAMHGPSAKPPDGSRV